MRPTATNRTTHEDLDRRNAKENELDALINMRATADFCDRRVHTVHLWLDDGYKQGVLAGIQEYRDRYLTRNEGDN